MNQQKKTNPLKVERVLMMKLYHAYKQTYSAIGRIDEALELPCYDIPENSKEKEHLHKQVYDVLVIAKDNIESVMMPYMKFHDVDFQDISEWRNDDEDRDSY